MWRVLGARDVVMDLEGFVLGVLGVIDAVWKGIWGQGASASARKELGAVYGVLTGLSAQGILLG